LILISQATELPVEDEPLEDPVIIAVLSPAAAGRVSDITPITIRIRCMWRV
jgi:hypothetical protein